MWPLVKSLSQEIIVDGEVVSGDGSWTGQYCLIKEYYEIPNPVNWLDTLISERGTASPKSLNASSINTQTVIQHTWRFDQYGAMVGAYSFRAVQDFLMVGGSSYDYIGGWQHQTLFRTGETLWQYVPDLSGSVAGYDLKATADVTSNTGSVQVNTGHCTSSGDPASHFVQFTKLSGTPQVALGMGYIRTKGQGLPANRSQNTRVWQMSNSEKQYPVAVDGARYSGTIVPSGTQVEFAFWDYGWAFGSNTTHTCDAVYEDGGYVWRVIDIHDTVSYQRITMPSNLEGRAVTLYSSGGTFTLHSDIVTCGTITVSTSGGWGRGIIRVGP